MSIFRTQAVAALRKIENNESLDESAVAIIVVGLNRIIREGRTPFQRFRDHYIIGTERFNVTSGLDYLRVILMHQKSTARHSNTNLSEISAFEVYTASQVEPPQAHNADLEDVIPDFIFPPESDVGPSCGTSSQRFLDPKAIASLRQYAKELSTHDSIAAVELSQELELYLRKLTPGSEKIKQGNLEGVVKAFERKYFYHGTPRTFRKPSQNIADKVRNSIDYAINVVLPENPATIDISRHLRDNVSTGQVCEYTGDWKWLFVKKL